MSKMVIYQLLPRLFGNTTEERLPHGTLQQNGTGKFASINTTILRRIHDLGATHIWYTGIIRHATTTDYSAYGIPRQHPAVVKGLAGSPYAITDYYDVDPDLAQRVGNRMTEFHALITRTHNAGMRVVIDFVPNHVARQYRSVCRPVGVKDLGADDNDALHFSPTNDFYYCVNEPFVSPVPGDYYEFPARATGNDCFSAHPSANDWYETVKLNYGIDYNDWCGTPSTHFFPVPPLWTKMTNILLFWADKGIDAFRCDMAEMVPTDFWHYAIALVKARHPQVEFIGEVYDKWQYRRYLAAGFDYLYDKVGMYDTLRAVITGSCHTTEITRRWQETDDIHQHMLYFLENHDEQRIASNFFCGDAQAALPAVAIELLLNTNPFMLYAGQEYGERGMDAEGFSGCDGRTTIFDYWCVDTLRRGYFARTQLTDNEKSIEQAYRTLISLAQRPEVTHGKMFDLMYVNPHLAQRQYAFLRAHNDGEKTAVMLVVANFADSTIDTDLIIPAHAFDYLALRPGHVTAIEQLSQSRWHLALRPDTPLPIAIPPHATIILTW